MLTFYVVAAIVGGVFVLLSALGGLGKDGLEKDLFDKDFDAADLDTDAGVEAGAGVEAESGAESGGGHAISADHSELWLPFLSMRFWTYFFAVFGVTGLLLTSVWREGMPTAVLSSLMGLACGLGMAYATRYLRRSTTSSGVGVRDFVGVEAVVLFGVSDRQSGKIRAVVKGREVDLLATTDEAGPIERGARVMIIGFEGPRARVVRASFAEPLSVEPSAMAVSQEVAETAARRVKT
jgi:hypothetical protein